MAEQTNVHTTNQQSPAVLKLTTGSGSGVATNWGRGTMLSLGLGPDDP
jgi:hypothetical protein